MTKTAAELPWITIHLVGENDETIPRERYRIKLADDSRREGRLDAEGLARVRGIQAGQCTVTFPDLDEEAWVPIRTTGGHDLPFTPGCPPPSWSERSLHAWGVAPH